MNGKGNIMTIHGKITFKDAIIVDKKLLEELEKVILIYYDKVSYSCKLCNDNRIDFDTLDELLNYENPKIRKIIRLSIMFGYPSEIVFEPSFAYFSSYKYTVEGTYQINDLDKSVLFQEKIKDLLNRSKQDKWYTILTKINIVQFWIVMLAFCTCTLLYSLFTNGLKQESSFSLLIFIVCIIISTIFHIFGYILSKFRIFLLPAIAYKIGEQIKEIEKGRELSNKIFWGIIVAFIVSLVVAFIS